MQGVHVHSRLFVVCGLIHALFSSNIKEENKSGNCGLQFKICELMVNIYFRFILLLFICFGFFFFIDKLITITNIK